MKGLRRNEDAIPAAACIKKRGRQKFAEPQASVNT